MIKIREATAEKMSGTSSLFISFDFNQHIVDALKSLNNYTFDKKTREWEIPISELADALDKLTFIDDIELSVLPDDDNKEVLTPILTYKVKPFKHQLDAVAYGLKHENWLLLDSPGLGKSAEVIHLAEELKAQKGLEHCLVICGIASLRANWEKEIEKHSDLSYITIGKKITKKGNVRWDTLDKRAIRLKNPIDEFFIIINIESIRDKTIIDAIRTTKNNIGMVVFDECHKASKKSQQGENLLKLINFERKIGMTGTLILNNPISAFLPLKWIGVEHATLTNFKRQYCVFGGFRDAQIIGYKNLDLLKQEIESCSLRRTKEDILDLPEKTVINEIVEMDEKHKKFYEAVKDGIKEECDKIVLDTKNTLSMAVRLKEATVCPSMLTTENIMSSKMQRCVDLCDEIISNGDKVVILSSFKEPVYQLRELLKDYNPVIATGDIPDDQVSKNIDLFQTDPKYKVFIGTHAKAGTGISLNAARYSILLDLPKFSYAQTLQSEDRIHRVNNTQSVFIYRLICEGTVDEVELEIIEKKKAIGDFMIDGSTDVNTLTILQNYILDL